MKQLLWMSEISRIMWDTLAKKVLSLYRRSNYAEILQKMSAEINSTKNASRTTLYQCYHDDQFCSFRKLSLSSGISCNEKPAAEAKRNYKWAICYRSEILSLLFYSRVLRVADANTKISTPMPLNTSTLIKSNLYTRIHMHKSVRIFVDEHYLLIAMIHKIRFVLFFGTRRNLTVSHSGYFYALFSCKPYVSKLIHC